MLRNEAPPVERWRRVVLKEWISSVIIIQMKTAVVMAIALASTFAKTVPSGTEVQVRITAKVGSSASKAGDPVQAVVISPVRVQGDVVIWPGITVAGTVKSVLKAPAAKQQPQQQLQAQRTATSPQTQPQAPVPAEVDSALLVLDFSVLRDTSGKETRFSSRITTFDNARETVDSSGVIHGIVPSKTYSGKLDQELGKLGGGLGGLFEAAKNAIIKEPDPEITLEVGAELSLLVKEDFDWDAEAGDVKWIPAPPVDELVTLVNGQPFQTVAEKPPKPSDITNLMFVGTQQQIEAAFKAAGWTIAAATTKQSSFETIRALGEDRGYQAAPMSTLLLEGQKAAMNWEKQYNTFARRHHLRVFARPTRFQDKPVWVSSSTHDIGISFSKENRTFIHRVDSHIYAERDKVASDLLYTGLVGSVYYVDRPSVPKEGMNATGDKLLTDARMAVLIF